MREILFRGKDVKENWYIGLLAKSGNGWYISNSAGIPLAYEVIPSTVGQYTGLTDKNGKKIFEGDIVDDQEFIGVVKYNEIIASFVVEINDTNQNYYHWSPLNMGDPSREKQLKYTEIVGNLHDNPELLKEAEQ